MRLTPLVSPARLWAMVVKEFVQMRRDRLTFGMTLGIPMIQLILFGFAINADPKHLPTAVVLADRGPQGRTLLHGIQNSGYFEIVRLVRTEAEGAEILARGEAQFVVNIPAGFSRVRVGGSINSPTAMAFLPDGRIFVCEQTGAVRVIKDGTLLAEPFLQVSVTSTGERGLLGIAIDPDFETNSYVYVYYTVPVAPRHNRISRFTADGDVALADSETLVLRLDNLSSATNHNGGAMHFGLDGQLYVSIG